MTWAKCLKVWIWLDKRDFWERELSFSAGDKPWERKRRGRESKASFDDP